MPISLQFSPKTHLLTITKICAATGRVIDLLESDPEVIHVHSLGHICPECADVSRFAEDSRELPLLKYTLYLAIRAGLEDGISDEQLAEDHRDWVHNHGQELSVIIEDMEFEMLREVARHLFVRDSFKMASTPTFFREFTVLPLTLSAIDKVCQG